MIKPLSLKMLADRYAGAIPSGDCQFDAVSTDTRRLKKNDLFIALKGPNYDAHDFLQSAIDRGACGLVVEKPPRPMALPYWLVADTQTALAQIASLQRAYYRGRLVAVTGSTGKTTVKGLLSSILSAHSCRCGGTRDQVFATEGNLNNHIGLPLSLLSLAPQHRFAVLEMGASAMGEIDRLTDIAKPHVAVITNVMPAHVEGFGSIAHIARAKGEIFNGLSSDGTAVINKDDTFAEQWLRQNKGRHCLTFTAVGAAAGAAAASQASPNVWAENTVIDSRGRGRFRLCTDDAAIAVELPLLGLHNVSNALAAATCAMALAVDLNDIKQGLESFSGDGGRLQVTTGYNQCTLLDDSYNANPGSVAAAIDVLSRYRQQKLLVLGDMCELGENASDFHRQMGRYANDNKIDCLLTFGRLSRYCQQAFNGVGDHFDDVDRLVDAIKSQVNSHSVVLIKGSRSLHMEKVVAALSQG